MEELFESLGMLIGVLLFICLIVFIISSVFWGIGSVVTIAFGINYTWTLFHGFASMLVYGVIKGILNINGGE